jgi:hypothetical protein
MLYFLKNKNCMGLAGYHPQKDGLVGFFFVLTFFKSKILIIIVSQTKIPRTNP